MQLDGELVGLIINFALGLAYVCNCTDPIYTFSESSDHLLVWDVNCESIIKKKKKINIFIPPNKQTPNGFGLQTHQKTSRQSNQCLFLINCD